MADLNSLNVEFRLVTKLVADLGVACYEQAGITNPDAIPEMVEFVKIKAEEQHDPRCDLTYQNPEFDGPCSCSCGKHEAQALLKKAGVK